MTKPLPHDEYIAAVCDALTTAGIELTDHCWTDDGETRGTYCYLDAVITLDPSGTVTSGDEDAKDDAAWPHGLLLIWEWHTGIEAADGEPERGPSWEWARLVDSHGQCGERAAFTALGYPSPAYVVESVRALIDRRSQAVPAERWEHADALDAECEAWGADEASQ